MKTIINFIKGIIIACWAVIAIFTTVCLLSWNNYGVSEFGDYSLFVMDNKSLEPDFHKNDLILVEKGLESDYKVGDQLFFYMGNNDIKSYINKGEVTEIEVNENAEDAFYFGDAKISYGSIIGSASEAKTFKGVGLVLNLLESRWGFMFIIILPTIYAVVYEIYSIVVEVKKELKKEEKDGDDEVEMPAKKNED